MAMYKYSAISRTGERVTGEIDGYNEFDAVARIRETCDVILKVTEMKEGASSFLSMDLGANRLDYKAFTVMCSQFAIILRSGIPIARAVHLVADKTDNKALKKILNQAAVDVEAGRSLSSSFGERGAKLFPPTFIETLYAGEESGGLAESFQTMYEHYDKQTKMRAKVKGALAYPAFVMVVGIVVVIVIMAVVVPRFTVIFDGLGGQLPLMTRILIAVSNFFKKYFLIIFAVLFAGGIAFRFYSRTENGKLKIAKTSLKLPVFGNIISLNAASQFSGGMASMLAAGLPITRALTITANALDNYYIRQEVGKLGAQLEEGRGLAAGMAEAHILPDILVDMVAVGEETGEMERTLRTISGYYDNELQTAVDAAMQKLEPTILVFLAVFAGFIVISIYMAMFSIYGMM